MVGFNECKALWEVWEKDLKVDYNERSECIWQSLQGVPATAPTLEVFLFLVFEHLRIVRMKLSCSNFEFVIVIE